jgi:hypothetical protein
MYDNKVIQNEADVIIDTTETNPFGRISWLQTILTIELSER